MKSYIILEEDRKLTFELNKFVFPGGEVGIRILNSEKVIEATTEYKGDIECYIDVKLKNSNDILELLMLKDAIDRLVPDLAGKNRVHYYLNMLYVPYGRQDRVCAPGESFSLKVFTDLINNLNFDKVIVADAHSNVTTTLLNNVVEISQLDKFKEVVPQEIIDQVDLLISPDLGASKKTTAISNFIEKRVISAEKERCKDTGNIINTRVHADLDELKGTTVLIPDDIIDGGRTLVELTKILKEIFDVKTVYVYVTHGIFSRGTNYLFDNGIDSIFTSDSFNTLADAPADA